jgi:hypothetical protein
LPEQTLLTTGTVDHGNWNYRPILGPIQQIRFYLIRSRLRGSYAQRLLEIGYGSGIFLPELRGTLMSSTASTPIRSPMTQITAQTT